MAYRILKYKEILRGDDEIFVNLDGISHWVTLQKLYPQSIGNQLTNEYINVRRLCTKQEELNWKYVPKT